MQNTLFISLLWLVVVHGLDKQFTLYNRNYLWIASPEECNFSYLSVSFVSTSVLNNGWTTQQFIIHCRICTKDRRIWCVLYVKFALTYTVHRHIFMDEVENICHVIVIHANNIILHPSIVTVFNTWWKTFNIFLFLHRMY